MSHVYAARACLPAMIARGEATSIQRLQQVCRTDRLGSLFGNQTRGGIVCREFGDHPRG